MPTVLITGANRGLGIEFVRQYADRGWKVIATCRDLYRVDALKNVSNNIEIRQLDVMDYDSIDKCSNELKGTYIDVLILNAGIFPQKGASLAETDFEGWNKTFQTNSISAAKLALSFKDNLLLSNERKLVALSSKAGSMSDNHSRGNFLYRSSKAALNSIIVGLAQEFYQQIICAAIIPGMTKTDMGGPGAPRTPNQSVHDMISVISNLTEGDTGKFLDFKGQEIPW